MSVLPYGSWPSPIDAAMVAAGGVEVGSPWPQAGRTYWLETRPQEGGRSVVVAAAQDGSARDVTPEDFYVRTRVHEYGGGAFFVSGETVFFSNFIDQRLYRQDGFGPPVAITPVPDEPASVRYADGRVSVDGQWIFCVRESHLDGDVRNEIVSLSSDGLGETKVLAQGHDFFSNPRPSPDGTKLVWLAWDHPQMPWDGTELWVADLAADATVSNSRLVTGGVSESIFQPEWSPQGVLHFVSDRTGWWNLYRESGDEFENLLERNAEFGGPHWQFGASTYAFLPDGRVVCRWSEEGLDHIGTIDEPGRLKELGLPFTSIVGVKAEGESVFFRGAGPLEAGAIVRLDLAAAGPPQPKVLKRGRNVEIDRAFTSTGEPIAFPTTGGHTAHALYYAPTNADFVGTEGELPPLVVMSHGGPTGAVTTALNLSIQYFTTRGIAVIDVNYRGSTGYGRLYRDLLKGEWGVADVDDCVNAALYLADQGLADRKRLAIRGGSAGGYTTLCALTFRDVFGAGASYYGVADAAALASETHKFESRYLDGLIGPYPEEMELYRQRSPIHFADQLSCPLILFQGLDDLVVPPNQSEMMAAALAERGIPHAYLAFEGEAHGFRKAETNRRCLEAELYFYSRVFGFELADLLEPIKIENL